MYFDGACPLCAAEINLYRRMPGADGVAWVDVTATDDLGPALDKERALARFHLRRADGRLVSGARAFAELWRQMPRLRLVGEIAARPPLVWLLEGAYRLFLPVRPLIRKLIFVNRGCGGSARAPKSRPRAR